MNGIAEFINRAVPEFLEIPSTEPDQLRARPYRHRSGHEIPARPWQYPGLFLRGFLTVTIAPGGVGKTTLGMLQAVAMATGKPLLGVQPVAAGGVPVLIFNGEDPQDEIDVRLNAIIKHHGPKHGFSGKDLEANVHVLSGRDQGLIFAKPSRDGVIIDQEALERLQAYLRDNGIKHIVLDPFIAVHHVNENDNGAIEQVATLLVQIAHDCDASMHLIHHSRKANGAEVTEDSARGASSLMAKARISKTLQFMGDTEAHQYNIPISNRFSYVRVNDGKVNLAARDGAPLWLKLVGVEIGNGDSIQTVELWEPPARSNNVKDWQAEAILKVVQEAEKNGRPYRQDPTADNWLGWDLSEPIMGITIENRRKKDQSTEEIRAKLNITGMIQSLLNKGVLITKDEPDRYGKPKPHIHVGTPSPNAADIADLISADIKKKTANTPKKKASPAPKTKVSGTRKKKVPKGAGGAENAAPT
jgi:hypothetical protein